MNMDMSQMLKSGWLGCAGGEKRSKVSVACLTYLTTDFSRHCTSVTSSCVHAGVYVRKQKAHSEVAVKGRVSSV